MRILSVGNFGKGWDGSICDEEHIAKALENLGHEVIRHQRETGWDEPLPNVDFVLIAQWDGYPENIFPHIPIPLVYWAFDYQADGQEWHEKLVKQSDLYLSKRIADVKYPNWHWLSQDFAPSFLDKYRGDTDKDIDVLFTGTYLPWATERNQTLEAIDNNFDLTIHSVNAETWKAKGFKKVFGPVMDEELPRLIARTKVNISIDHILEAGYWSDRNAQIMCCGAKPLFRYVPMSEHTFHDYVDYFYGIDDCLEKIEQQLTTYNWSMSSYNYAQANLKVKNRVQDLLTIVRQYYENSPV